MKDKKSYDKNPGILSPSENPMGVELDDVPEKTSDAILMGRKDAPDKKEGKA